MNIRVDWITFALMGLALFMIPDVPSWYAIIEQIFGWILFVLMAMITAALLFFMRNGKTKFVTIKLLVYAPFNWRAFLLALVVNVPIIISAYLQGFMYLSYYYGTAVILVHVLSCSMKYKTRREKFFG